MLDELGIDRPVRKETNEGFRRTRTTNRAYCSQHHGQGGSVEGLAEQERAGRFRSRFEDETAFRAWYDATPSIAHVGAAGEDGARYEAEDLLKPC